MLTMTIVISTYQRRDPVVRLLRALDAQVAEQPELRDGLDLVVVVDGSDDGTREAVEAMTLAIPCRMQWQENRGLASARNAGLGLATGKLTWFLDDDLVPAPGLLARHRGAHGAADPEILMGMCRVPLDAPIPQDAREWWDSHHRALGQRTVVDRFDFFTAANTSGPTELFRAIGGFDDSFVGYGLEDFELGARLLDAGARIRFDAEALAWHPEFASFHELVRRQRSIGRNCVFIARKHPQLADILFPVKRQGGAVALARRIPFPPARLFGALSRTAEALAVGGRRLPQAFGSRAERLALIAAFASGVAEADDDGRYLRRVLGHHD